MAIMVTTLIIFMRRSTQKYLHVEKYTGKIEFWYIMSDNALWHLPVVQGSQLMLNRYIQHCIREHLVAFKQRHDQNTNIVFCILADKASAHTCKLSNVEFLPYHMRADVLLSMITKFREKL